MTALILAKLAGGICVLICGFLAGNERLLRLTRSRRLIVELLRLLSQLEENFRYKNDPLPQFFARGFQDKIFGQLELPRELLRQDFAAFMKSAGESVTQSAPLPPETQSVWHDFWAALGTTPGEEECQRIEWCRAQLKRSLEELEQKEKEAARLDRMIGLTTAAVMVVLLL